MAPLNLINSPTLKKLSFAVITALSCSAQAQQTNNAQPTKLSAITVSAQKQEQKLIEVPQSVTVVSGEEIETQALDTLEDVAPRVPNLLLPPSGQSGLVAPTMRGINAGIISFSTALPMYIDGVPVLRAQGFESTLIDIDRIEVLRGPQGTLYGRNAEVGAINIFSRKPDNELRAGVLAEIGERNKRKLQLKASGPLVKDTFYASIAGDTTSQDGYIDNTTSDEKEDDRKQDNARLQLRWTPGENTDIVLTGSYQQHDDGGQVIGLIDSPRYEMASDADSYNKSNVTAFSLNIQHRFENDVQLDAITAQHTHEERVRQDIDLTAMPAARLYKHHDFNRLSQELRLQGDLGSHHWLVGAYADRDENDLGFDRYTGMGDWLTAHDLGACRTYHV